MNPDPNEIKRALHLLYLPEDTIELRAFLRGSQILNGYYRNRDGDCQAGDTEDAAG